ncbi:ATP-binding protein [Paenibacillus sp. MBLB4367]|uniref:sensor histidine kinase n=1 Tax=Paenibacillus sp. MBLB4367 TaxID=3384767 RepID=UPI00390820D6
MSIRIRLLLSHIAMVVVPIVLLLLAMGLVSTLLLGDDSSLYRVFKAGSNLKAMQTKIEGELQYISGNDSKKLLDPAYLEPLNRRLDEMQSGIAVAVSGAVVYSSPSVTDYMAAKGMVGADALAKALPSRRDKAKPLDTGTIVYQTEIFPFPLSGGGEGTLYFFTNNETKFAGLRPLQFLIMLLALAVTNGVLTYIVSRSIIKPLYTLKRAAETIKDGDLDFEVKPTTNDEIGEVSVAFEEMRRRLKDSIDQGMQYEENRKELISHISHDLKTPITSIKGYVEGILDGVANSPQKQETYMRRIYHRAVEMDRLIDELFLFSKLDLKKLPFHFERLDIVRYARDCMEEMRIDLEKEGIELHYDAEDCRPVIVVADREKLNRVMVNIIENSMKYMRKPSTGSKRISAALIDGANEVTIRISDNGPGVPEHALEHIFDSFYRAEPSRSAGSGGSGLGLSIVRHIVNEHGGKVWAASEEGRGMTITFTLPKPKEDSAVMQT